jgi:hypothetical protein
VPQVHKTTASSVARRGGLTLESTSISLTVLERRKRMINTLMSGQDILRKPEVSI